MTRKKERTSSKGQALSRALQSLNSIYQRMPVLPFFDKASSALLIISIAAVALFTAFVFLTTPSPTAQVAAREAPLHKNAQLALVPGEQYAYTISMGNQSQWLYYSASKSDSCPGTLLTEKQGAQTRDICLSGAGVMIGNGSTGSNVTFGNSSTLLFSPWMLAASENFSWEVATLFSAGSTQISFPTYFNSQGRATVAGREAYPISISADAAIVPTVVWNIDAQKRVLLSADMENLTIRLVKAPFELNWSNNSAAPALNTTAPTAGAVPAVKSCSK
ncbi:Uncharacterised protein [uncultured archaeon]|nr:Uncharacterised protein [uncultured archaeon]